MKNSSQWKNEIKCNLSVFLSFLFWVFFWENGENNCGIIEECKAKDKCGLRWDGDENDERDE